MAGRAVMPGRTAGVSASRDRYRHGPLGCSGRTRTRPREPPMHAVVTTNYGSTPLFAKVDTPTPGPDDVRVRVHTSSVNGFDVALAAGYLKDLMEHRFPVVLGRDFAGIVDEVGVNVTAFAPGDDVFGMVLTQPLNAGAFAEYLVVPQDHHIARMPAGLDHATAGVLTLAGASAMTAVDAARVADGDTVLVSGATGG